jgi:hypothetical protein
MELLLKDKLTNAFKHFSDRDQARILQKEQQVADNPEHHETSQSESDESEVSKFWTKSLRTKRVETW